MQSETKNCQNCKQDFVIEPEDFNFYEKMKVSAPTWCPECRQRRRYAWRNERTLYRRNCDLCGKSTVTIYSPNKPFKVYCLDCWWSDKWDFASYGRDFDFSRPFFDQFSELQHDVPRMALLNKRGVNSEYTNHSSDNKNVYLSFVCFDGEDIMYSNYILKSRDCVDCSEVREAGERLYECIDSRKSYQCQHCILLKDCSSCLFCYDCRGCTDCFMSTNLRNKSYVFRNKQYTREEYLEKMKDYDTSSFSVCEELKKEFKILIEKNAIHRYIIGEKNINSIGSFIHECKNTFQSFDVDKGEDCKYLYASTDVKDCMDIYHVGFNSDLCYEIHGCTRVSNCQFSHLCYDDMNIMYSDSCQNSENLFGCVSAKKGEYMIFNKKYSKENYLNLKEKIIEHMKKTGEYGEFFPVQMAPVYYNETQGAIYMPMTKDEVLAKGWKWEENVPGTFGKETIKREAIPDKIEDVPDSFLNEVFVCESCSKNYNIVKNELLFYRKENIPLPRKCPSCRYGVRFSLRPARKLWHGSCLCDKKDHADHLNSKCLNKFETPYVPGKIEKLYCENCYNKEVY